jgi:hypothetical protein
LLPKMKNLKFSKGRGSAVWPSFVSHPSLNIGPCPAREAMMMVYCDDGDQPYRFVDAAYHRNLSVCSSK